MDASCQTPEEMEDGERNRFDPSAPLPMELALAEGSIDEDDMDWAEQVGLRHVITTREGATFMPIAPDVFLIAVYGGQYMHDDRDVTDASGGRVSPHTWNLVVSPGEGQLLLCEVGDRLYEHFVLERGSLIYMNTSNAHAVTRKSPTDCVVIAQVGGFGPDQAEEAVTALRDALRRRLVLPR